MRPMLKRGLVQLWRDESTLQFGTDARHAVVLAGLDPSTRGVLQLLDGTRDRDEILDLALITGVDEPVVAELLDRLTTAGVLDDGDTDLGLLRRVPLGVRDRLAPELAALSLLHPAPGHGSDVLARRHEHRAALVGPGGDTLAAALVPLLTAAGLGGVVRITGAESLGAQLVRHCPDIVIAVGPALATTRLAETLARSGIPQLFTHVREATGVVGPLVVPGVSACVRCLHMHRSDRDPAWPTIALQLARTAPPAPACPAGVAAVVAGTTALQALAWIDGEHPATVNGTLELALPDWRLRRRSWPPHSECSCGAASGVTVRYGAE